MWTGLYSTTKAGIKKKVKKACRKLIKSLLEIYQNVKQNGRWVKWVDHRIEWHLISCDCKSDGYYKRREHKVKERSESFHWTLTGRVKCEWIWQQLWSSWGCLMTVMTWAVTGSLMTITFLRNFFSSRALPFVQAITGWVKMSYARATRYCRGRDRLILHTYFDQLAV